MNKKYKLIISSRNIYREVELPTDAKTYRVGTSIDCNYRLHRELFFEDIEMQFSNNDETWSVMCSDNLYISTGSSNRLFTYKLSHGDNISVRYRESNGEAFEIEFTVDFDTVKRNFERRIDISNVTNIFIGAGNENDVVVKSDYIVSDKIELIKKQDGLLLNMINYTYGVYHNGNRAENYELIKDGDFISISDFMFFLKDNGLWTEAANNCIINRLAYSDYIVKNNYPKFVRNTRVKVVLDESEIEILDPPEKPQKPKNNLLTGLLPSMGMLLTAGVMAFMGGAMIVISLISALMAIMTTIVGVIQGKKDYENDINERVEKYNLYIQNKRNEINECREKEVRDLNRIYIPSWENKARFNDFSSDLFDRRREDSDFLNVRLGTGKVNAAKKINYKKQERLEISDNLQELPQCLCQEYKMIDNAPVICSLKDINALGITGAEEYRYELFKTIVMDIIARHFYSDVKLFFIADKEHTALFKDFRFLPYVENTIPNMRNIAVDDESKKIIFESLYNVLTLREQQKEYDEHLIIFLYDQCGFRSHPVSKFVDNAKELGVTFIFFEKGRENLPLGCDKIISIAGRGEGTIVDSNDESSSTWFQFDSYTSNEVSGINSVLAAVEIEEISLEGSLTKNISLFELLNILSVDDLDLKQRWDSTRVYDSMAVPLGVSKTGVVNLDLHDKYHGPHGLVAGTTGSGKSEILQTYILSVATYFHPYEVAFVIIDFKGGGMVNQFRNLPHLLGAITNIDGKEINRSLKSIKAELQKRQRLFAEAEVNHIDKYIKKYKSGEVKIPIPHLIVIVDEFAELKAEQPDFMKELISAARIGRSLGVHLILATQKPAGQVDDQIWSNSKFKLCLKVQGPDDSNEVLKSPLAAEIKEPGRAYLQVGNNEIFELFQSAYSGAGEKHTDDSVKTFRLSEVNISGKHSVVFEQKKQKKGDSGRTQLEAIVEYVQNYCEKENIAHLPSICLESLCKSIDFNEKAFAEKGAFDIGIYDDPDNQYQGITPIDIDAKNTLIIGSSQYGKTNLLQLLIREIAVRYSPAEANIYIIDFGSMVLKNFETLNHVGGVVCSSDDEKLKNLFKLLLEEIAIRKEKLVSVGVSSFQAYCEAGKTDLPRIYVFVDNITALMELYLENDDTLLTISREGLAVGISVIIANTQTAGIGYKYISNFANRIALYCNDSNEYGNIFDHVTIKPDDVPGRCIIELEKRMLECQSYLAFNGEKEIDRVKEIKAFISERNRLYDNQHAKKIPFIPALLTTEIIEKDFAASTDGYKMAVGLSYNEVTPFYMDFAKIGALALCGKEKKGHKNFVGSLLNRLSENRTEFPVRVIILDDISRKYKEYSDIDIVETYTLDMDIIMEKLTEWHSLLEGRYQAMMSEYEPEDNSLLLLIIQNNDIAAKIYEDMDVMRVYSDIVGRYKALNVCVLYANFDNVNVSYDAPEPLRMIKQEQNIVLFDDLDSLKVFDVPYEELRANKKKLQLGDAYYIRDNSVTKLKLIKCL